MKSKSNLGENPAATILNRRRLLQFLAASPVIAGKAKDLMAAEGEYVPSARAEDPYIWKPYDPNFLLEKAEDALDVFDFEATAHKNMIASFSQTHWGFMSTGADSEDTYRANRHDMSKFVIRSRRLRGFPDKEVDTTRTMFGTKWSQPFFICPTGRNGAYHAEGEVGVGKAAGKHNVMQCLAPNSTFGIPEVNKARGNGTPVVFQLYQQGNFEHSKALLARAEREGCKAVMLTVDGVSSRKDMQFARQQRDDKKLCLTCHTIRPGGKPTAVQLSSKIDGNFKEFTEEMYNQKFTPDSMTWDWPKRVRDVTKMDIFIKGITDVEDALMCIKLGYGIHVSNHGGRNEDTGRSTINSLSQIAPAVKGRAPIFVDSGFRRGMDIVKALAMGATMVGFGRPYIWGLGAFGADGVDKVISILKAETLAAMQQVGAGSVKELTPDLIQRAL